MFCDEEDGEADGKFPEAIKKELLVDWIQGRIKEKNQKQKLKGKKKESNKELKD